MTVETFRNLFLEANRRRNIPMDEFAAQEISRYQTVLIGTTNDREPLLQQLLKETMEQYPVEGYPV